MATEKFDNDDILGMNAAAVITDRRGAKYVTGLTAQNCDTAGEAIDGVVVSGSESTVGRSVGLLDEAYPKVESGAAYADQAKLTVDSQGRFVTAVFGDVVDAIAMEAAANTGELHPAKLLEKAQYILGTGRRVVRTALTSPVSANPLTDDVIIVNLTVAGAVAVTLAAAKKNMALTIVDGKGDAGTNNITITPAAGTIDGAGTKVISSNRGKVTLISDGTNWFSIA